MLPWKPKEKKIPLFFPPCISHRPRIFGRVIKNRIIISLPTPATSEEEMEKTKEVKRSYVWRIKIEDRQVWKGFFSV